MRIVSKTKDYYDYVAKIEGIDDSLTFVRNKELPICSYTSLNDLGCYTTYYRSKDPCREFIGVDILILCGICFPLTDHVLSKEEFESLIIPALNNRFNKTKAHMITNSFYTYDRKRLELHKALDSPILVLNHIRNGEGNYIYTFNEKIPSLEKIGLNKLLPPEEVYHILYNFLLLTKDNSMLEVGNKEAIVKHGFDLKTSFRK